MGVSSPKGILLCGPPGTGKTTLGDAICYEMGLPFKKIAGTEIISSMSGESESNIRAIFEEAKQIAPSIIFIDEIDSIATKRQHASKEMEKRIVIQLISCLDSIKNENVFVIATTSNVDTLDNSLRRTGRFDKEFSLGVPNRQARLKILQKMSKKLNISFNVSLKEIARLTPGFVGADLSALMKEAGMNAIRRIILIMK